MRLDQLLVEKGLCENRSRAQQVITTDGVEVDGKLIHKVSAKVTSEMDIVLLNKQYVSRAAFKLKHFLENNSVDIRGKSCLDVGSSTGGFVQVMLENGVENITAVDVGTNQLHISLREIEEVNLYEQTDIRDFRSPAFEFVTCDASFISLLNIIEAIDRLSSDKIVLLFKPQFEVGKEAKRNRKGVVVDEHAIEKAFEHFLDECKRLSWKLLIQEKSGIKGKEGNQEILCYFQK
jgi:23S rRNA (cytidine1920-2'-O)/16S rRNA (cytidine1409-2'-O)-methyltransferase